MVSNSRTRSTRKVTTTTSSLAAFFATFMVAVTPFSAMADAHPLFVDILAAEVQVKDDFVKMELYTNGTAAAGAPLNASYGYAALTSDLQNMLAVTTHIPVGDDSSAEEDETGFHTHVVSLNATSAVCESGIEVTSASDDPVGELKIDESEVKVTDVPREALGDLNGFVASFTLTQEGGSLCVNVAEVVEATD